MVLDNNLYLEINEYCKENGFKTRDFIHKILKEAFLKEKYGDTPFAFLKSTEKKDEVKSIIIEDKKNNDTKTININDESLNNDILNTDTDYKEHQLQTKKKKRKLQ